MKITIARMTMASQMNDPLICGAPLTIQLRMVRRLEGIRTPTGQALNLTPLPLGYESIALLDTPGQG